MTVEPVAAPRTVLSKHLFGSRWSPRRLLRGAPRVIAIFSFRYDAHLVPDLIENLRPIVDGYVAYDDRDASEAYTDERVRKAMLRDAAREMGAKWILCIDPDERLEMAASERMKEMTRTVEPVVWTFRLREMHTATAYRTDGRWKKKLLGCLFPVLDGQVFGDLPLHSRRNPLNPEYRMRNSGFNLYHLKMIDAERRKARCDFYKALDPANVFQKIGYDYLADETGLVLEEVPASRPYRPPYRETGTIWQPDLDALQPIEVPPGRETVANPTPKARDPAKSVPKASVRSHAKAPLRRVARNALNAVVKAFPETSEQIALFVLSQPVRPRKDRGKSARSRKLAKKPTPQKANPDRGKEGQSESSAGIRRRIASLFADPPEAWSAENLIFLMRALDRLDLLSGRAFHVLLTRLFAERHPALVRSLVDDGSLGFDRVRDFHRLRLRSFLGEKSATLAELAELRTRAKGSFLYSPCYNELIGLAIRAGAVDDVEREIAAIGDASERVRLGEDIVLGACRLFSANGRDQAAVRLLEQHLAPLDEEQRLRFLEPLFSLDDKGALSPALRDYCAGFRPDIGAKTTERLSEVYVAFDGLDREQFGRRVVEPLRALHNADLNLMDVRFCPQQKQSLIDTIVGKLNAKQPLALIRLGDGESYVFSSPDVEGIDPRLFAAGRELRERHWWGVSPPADIASDIKRAVRHAIEECDILGLPSVHRVLRVIARPKLRFGETQQQRGLMTVLAATNDNTIPLAGKVLTEERCHQCVFDHPALKAMVAAAESVVVVSCWPEARLRFANGRIKYVRVPPHQKVKHLAEGEDEPIFASYREIAAEVRAHSEPGTLVLVGAGIVGKIFIGEAKRAGAVALDVGSLLDYMAGYPTRPLADAPSLGTW